MVPAITTFALPLALAKSFFTGTVPIAVRYRQELHGNRDDRESLRRLERKHGTITLLFGAKDEEMNNAVLLKKVLKPAKPKSPGKR